MMDDLINNKEIVKTLIPLKTSIPVKKMCSKSSVDHGQCEYLSYNKKIS